MSMYCPKCQVSYKQRLQCPKCGVRLEYQAGSRSLNSNQPGERGGWQETPWGRIGVGLLLAQGVYYGLWNLGNAGLLAANPELASTFWGTMTGLLVIQGLQAFGLLLGGALAGAGRPRGIMFGTMVGIWNGLIFFIMQSHQRDLLSPVALYGQPLLQTAFGAIGGAIGLFIWRPMPKLDEVAPKLAGRKSNESIPLSNRVVTLFKGPIAWFRVLLGSTAVVAGALSAGLILDFVLDAGQGKLTVETHLQAHLITWEITALAAAAGAALAGANTRNGLKQGLIVGILASVVLAGIALGRDKLDLMPMILTVSITTLMSLAGGAFGSSLFPPLYKERVTGQRRAVAVTA